MNPELLFWWFGTLLVFAVLPSGLAYRIGKRYASKPGISLRSVYLRSFIYSWWLSWSLTLIGGGHGAIFLPLPSWLVVIGSWIFWIKFDDPSLSSFPPWWINPWIIIFAFVLGAHAAFRQISPKLPQQQQGEPNEQ